MVAKWSKTLFIYGSDLRYLRSPRVHQRRHNVIFLGS